MNLSEICGKKFDSKISLESHQKTHDKNRPKPFTCQRCGHATDNKLNFERHSNVHQKEGQKFAGIENPENCQICLKLCRNKKL